MIYVFLALLALVILIGVLLNISVTLKVHYDKKTNVFRCTAHYLFISYVLTPKDERKKKKKKSSKDDADKKEKKKSSFADKIKARGLKGYIEDLKDIIAGAWNSIVCVLRRSDLKSLSLVLKVAGEDAADTAVIYGYANAVVYPIISALLENVRSYKELCVDISPDFDEDAQPDFELGAQLKIKPVRFIGAVIESIDEINRFVSALNR